MNLDTFFQIASPSTLASLIGDIDRADVAMPVNALELRTLAWRTLCANIGEYDALRLVLEEVGGVVA